MLNPITGRTAQRVWTRRVVVSGCDNSFMIPETVGTLRCHDERSLLLYLGEGSAECLRWCACRATAAASGAGSGLLSGRARAAELAVLCCGQNAAKSRRGPSVKPYTGRTAD
jgi:hypothetical protein